MLLVLEVTDKRVTIVDNMVDGEQLHGAMHASAPHCAIGADLKSPQTCLILLTELINLPLGNDMPPRVHDRGQGIVEATSGNVRGI